MAAKTDWKDYVPGPDGIRYNLVKESDGTYSIIDVTNYQVVGTKISALELNNLGKLVNGAVYPNLLRNSNFLNPVNQRGQTQYASAGYTIDGWAIAYNTLNIIPGGGIQLGNAPGLTSHMYQLLPTNSAGQQRTLTVNSSDGIFKVSGVMSAASEGVKLETPFGYITFYISNGYDAVLIDVSKKTTTLFWAKLEAGSVSTPYVAKSYAEELNECLRYYTVAWFSLNKTTNNSCGFTYPVPMRVKPTLTFSFIGSDAAPTVVANEPTGGLLSQVNGSYSSGKVIANAEI